MNIYGPYNNITKFWDSFKKFGMSKEMNLIIAGDLNFTMGAHEIWGPKARMDPLAPYFSNLLLELKLIDLDPQNLKPTWTNRWVGEERIAKRLEIFLMTEDILEEEFMFK